LLFPAIGFGEGLDVDFDQIGGVSQTSIKTGVYQFVNSAHIPS